jgi:hypothetical protein
MSHLVRQICLTLAVMCDAATWRVPGRNPRRRPGGATRLAGGFMQGATTHATDLLVDRRQLFFETSLREARSAFAACKIGTGILTVGLVA